MLCQAVPLRSYHRLGSPCLTKKKSKHQALWLVHKLNKVSDRELDERREKDGREKKQFFVNHLHLAEERRKKKWLTESLEIFLLGIIMGVQQPSALYSIQRGTVAEPNKQTSLLSKDGQSRVEDGPGFSVADIINSVEVTQMGEKYSSESVTVADITSSGTLTEEKRKEIQKNLMEKHTMECAQLENELRSNEIKAITDVITEYEQKKEKALTNLKEELRQKLKSASSEEEKEALLMEYASKMTRVQDEIEREKQKKLRDVRKQLKAERLKRKKDLYQ